MKREIILAFSVACLTACGSPSAIYRPATADDLKSPVTGAILFKLRTTNILIGSTEPNKTLATTDLCSGKSTEVDCLSTASVTANVAASGAFYAALPGDTVPFTHTTFTATTQDNNDSLVQSVVVSYNDQTKQVIAGASAGAVGGFALGGPVGAIFVGVISGAAAAAAAAAEQNAAIANNEKSFADVICASDNVDKTKLAHPATLKLFVPVVIGLNDESNADSGCWHLVKEHPPREPPNLLPAAETVGCTELC